MLVKGAIEDPALDRALSRTGFTTTEELMAQNLETTSALTLLYLKSNFEEPRNGWPEPLRIRRPNEEPEKKRKEKPKMASAAEVVSFTESNRGEDWPT